MARRPLDTQVPTEGAELLVQGMLCRAVIPTFKAPPFRSSYDLVSFNPLTKKSVTLQVKSRFQTDCDRGFIVSRVEADFFVFVFLNMGDWYDGKPERNVEMPEFYVIPRSEVCRRVPRESERKLRKFYVRRDNVDLRVFRDAWHLVADALDIEKEALLRAHDT